MILCEKKVTRLWIVQLIDKTNSNQLIIQRCLRGFVIFSLLTLIVLGGGWRSHHATQNFRNSARVCTIITLL